MSTTNKMARVPTIPNAQAIDYANQLIQELMRISLDEAGRKDIPIGILQDRIHGADGENSRKDRPDRSACTMHAESVQRIVIAKTSFYLRNHQVTQNARDETNDHGRHRFDKSRTPE